MKLQYNKSTNQYSVNLPLDMVKGMDWTPGIDIDVKFSKMNEMRLIKK